MVGERVMTVEELIAQRMAQAEKETVKKFRPAKTGVAVDALPKQACCGNCGYLTYNGINVVQQYWGVCEMYEQSDRFSNKPEMKACPFWKPRSNNRVLAEELYREKMIEAIGSRFIGKGGYADDKTKLPALPKELRKKELPDEALMLRKLLGLDPTNVYEENDDAPEDTEEE